MASVVTLPRVRKPLQPVVVLGFFSGGARISEICEGSAVLVIRAGDHTDADEQPYWCEAFFDGAGRVESFHLVKFGSGEKYNLPADLSSCDCPDHTFREERRGGCKHMAALRQALTILTGRPDAAPAVA
jgi:hypothetical protein